MVAPSRRRLRVDFPKWRGRLRHRPQIAPRQLLHRAGPAEFAALGAGGFSGTTSPAHWPRPTLAQLSADPACSAATGRVPDAQTLAPRNPQADRAIGPWRVQP